MASAEDALIEALEKRISNLETILLGSDPKAAQQLAKASRQRGQDVSSKIAQLLKIWSAKDQEWQKAGIAHAREEYERIQKEIDLFEDFSLDPASKLDIVLETSDSALLLAEKAQIMQSHKQYINSEVVGKVGDLSVELAPLATVHWEQVESTSQLNTMYHDIMVAYNDTIQLLSKKFVFWDSLLKLAEQEAARKR